MLKFKPITDKEEECYIARFVIEGTVTVEMSYDEPEIVPIDKYISLANGENVCLRFCGSNGDVAIDQKDGMVKFIVSKRGAGGDGDIVVTMPYSECTAAFKECVEWRSTF